MNVCKFGCASLLSLLLAACGGSNPSHFGQLMGTPTVIGTLTAAQLDTITAQNNFKKDQTRYGCPITQPNFAIGRRRV